MRGGVFAGGGCLVLVGLMLSVLYYVMCRGAMRVLGGLGEACLYGVCCGWGCIAPVLLLWWWCGAGF